jgi:hypothetical protein
MVNETNELIFLKEPHCLVVHRRPGPLAAGAPSLPPHHLSGFVKLSALGSCQ